MGLKDLTSKLDLVPGNNPVGDMETTPTIDLAGGFNQGETSTLKQDSLENIYQSAINPQATYGAGQPGATWPSVNPPPLPNNFADLNGVDGANGYFHGSNQLTSLQGKQLGQQDLHISLLENTPYTYAYGIQTQGNQPGQAGHYYSNPIDLDGGLPSSGKYVDKFDKLR